jgi:hypothetical protein
MRSYPDIPPHATSTNATNSVPSHILLGELDERLKTFIIDTARRHVAQTTRLPAIFVTVPVDGQPITVKTTVHVLSRSHTSEMPEVRSHVIELEFQRIPRAKCTLEIPATFELPHLPMLRPASDIGGHDEETQQRAFRVLSWISAHTIHRVFEPDSFDSYVDYLKRLACLGSSSNQEISGHGGLYGGNNLFTIQNFDAWFLISPSVDVVSDISSGYLPKICVVDKADALLRAIESAWEACAHRSDFETECVDSDETLLPSRCTCTFPERTNIIHRCDKCHQSFLCSDNAAQHAYDVHTVCTGCAVNSQPTQSKSTGRKPENATQQKTTGQPRKDTEQQRALRCHRCYVQSRKCTPTESKPDICENCVKYQKTCYPIKRTDDGELPETIVAKRRRQDKTKANIWEPRAPKASSLSKCHMCYVRGSKCKYTNPGTCDACAADGSPCRPIERTDAEELPETRYHRARRVARGENLADIKVKKPTLKKPTLQKTTLEIEMLRMQTIFTNKLNKELHEATKSRVQTSQDRDVLSLKHLPELWQTVEKLWLRDGGWPDAFLGIPRAFDRLGRPLLADQEGDIVDPDAFGNPGRNPYGPFGMVFDALKPVHVLEGSMVNHAPENLVPTSIFLNSYRHYYSPLILPLTALLCRDPSKEEMERISKKLDHIYLIAMQFPHANKGRYALLTDTARLDSIDQQHSTGIADAEACLKIDRSWGLDMMGRRKDCSRYGRINRHKNPSSMENVSLEAFITELEAHFNQKLPRAHGDGSAVYLLHPANTPVQWDWQAVWRFYGHRLCVMTRDCNQHYVTTCTFESLFALRCIQWMEAQRDGAMPWLLCMLQPYVRHPFRAVGGHIAHGLPMDTGFENENISFAAFREVDCNITWEPHVWNYMKGLYDALANRMTQKLRQDLPLDNSPYWTEDQVLAHAPDLPATQWGGVSTQNKSKNSKSKKSKSKKNKSKKDESKKGGQKPKDSDHGPASSGAPTDQRPPPLLLEILIEAT